MAKYRTINQALEEIKQKDPATSLTADFLRRACINGRIKHIKSGCKYLINFDKLEESLERLENERTEPPRVYRRVMLPVNL